MPHPELAAFAIALMAALSVTTGRQVTAERLPMQWGFSGRPTWFAPRVIALWFPVALAAGVVLTAISMVEQDKRFLISLIAAVFLALHALYVFLVRRWAANAAD